MHVIIVIIGITVTIAEDAEIMDVAGAIAAAITAAIGIMAVAAAVATAVTTAVATTITTGSVRHTAEVTLTATV